MLRFVSQGQQGLVLGLGLSEGNLQRLAGDEPIVFDLAELDLAGLFAIAIPGSKLIAELRDAGVEHYLFELSPEAMAELREQGAQLRELPGAPAGLAQVLLAHADTEVHLMKGLAEAGLLQPGVAWAVQQSPA